VESAVRPLKKSDLFDDANDETPVLFIACRLSAEKGVFDLAEIVALAKESLPDLKLVIAGSGPAEEELRLELPDALFLGWVDKQTLASVYSCMDLFVFPSRFDTFGNVLLEAFAHGMPAVAYDCKGPRDIIEHNLNGYLAGDTYDMAALIIRHFQKRENHSAMRAAARLRAAYYAPDRIMTQYVEDLGLPAPVCILEHRSAA
jgi:glycosyltransferase involved in cell wall biosynthesis